MVLLGDLGLAACQSSFLLVSSPDVTLSKHSRLLIFKLSSAMLLTGALILPQENMGPSHKFVLHFLSMVCHAWLIVCGGMPERKCLS